jgi:phage tail protein X
VPGTTDQLVLQKRAAPQPISDDFALRGQGRYGATQAAPAGSQHASRPATVLTPTDTGQAPPDLPRSYPNNAMQGSSRWGVSMGQMLPETATAELPLRTHTVVDGDTLASLADRYLGMKESAQAIFEANRDVLTSPQILPIGVELKIPPSGSLPPSSAVPEKRPLAPIP